MSFFSHSYKGFDYRGYGQQMADGRFEPKLLISRNNGANTAEKIFEFGVYLDKEIDAAGYAFHAAMDIIDGAVPHLTVEDLR